MCRNLDAAKWALREEKSLAVHRKSSHQPSLEPLEIRGGPHPPPRTTSFCHLQTRRLIPSMAAGCPVASRPLASACLIRARPHTPMHDGCGCAACADAGQECILPSTASPLLAGSWAPPCHRCPTKVCIAGRTGEEQPVLPFRDACHSNYLRSEPLLRRTFINCFAWVVLPLCLSDVGPAVRF